MVARAPRASPNDGPTFVDILTISTQRPIPWFERGVRVQNPQEAEDDYANNILLSFQWHEDTVKTNGRFLSKSAEEHKETAPIHQSHAWRRVTNCTMHVVTLKSKRKKKRNQNTTKIGKFFRLTQWISLEPLISCEDSEDSWKRPGRKGHAS